jgi:hypothetical protein
VSDHDHHDASDAAPPTRVEIVGGGSPTAQQLAALVVALTPVPVEVPSDVGADVGPGRLPAWTRAALHEGLGGRRVVRPGDLAGLR